MNSELIESFLDDSYMYAIQYWESLAEIAKKLCEKTLAGPSVQAIFSSRGKSKESLRDKLKKRNEKSLNEGKGGYQTQKDILNDIWDLAGVRIALYFPNQQDAVTKALSQAFVVEKVRDHPSPDKLVNGTAEIDAESEDSISPGLYKAKHLLVRVKQDKGPGLPGWEPHHMVEIQIQSVLMHAWAQVEHDITYKALFSDPSEAEKSALNMINNFMQTGDEYLDKLHSHYKKRIRETKDPIKEAWQLQIILHKYIDPRYIEDQNETPKLLHNFLISTKYDTLDALIPILKELGIKKLDTSSNEEKLQKVIDEYKPFHPRDSMRTSFGIMAYILSKLPSIEELIAQDQNMQSSVDVSYSLKCKTLLSCILWLQDLSPPKVADHIYRTCKLAGAPDGKVDNALRWLLTGPRRIEIMDGEPVAKNDGEDLDILWE